MSGTLPDDFYQETAEACLLHAESFPRNVALGMMGTRIETACGHHSSLLKSELEHMRQSHIEMHDEMIVAKDALAEIQADANSLRIELTEAMKAESEQACDNAALRARCERLEGALRSIARAPAFDANTQSIVDLARAALAQPEDGK